MSRIAKPFYYRILPDVFFTRHLNEGELVDAQIVYHPFRTLCNRFLLGGFLAVSILLFAVAKMCSHRLFEYNNLGYLPVYIISAIYHLLFPLAVYFIIRTKKEQTAPAHYGGQGKASKWLPALTLFYPVLVFVSYYLFRSSVFSNEIVYGVLKLSTFISFGSFLVWSYLVLVRGTTYYLLLCGAAGAFCAFMQFKATSSSLFEVEQYYFLLDISLPLYFIGLVISILAFMVLQSRRKFQQ